MRVRNLLSCPILFPAYFVLCTFIVVAFENLWSTFAVYHSYWFMESNIQILKRLIIIDDDEDLLYTFNHWLLSKSFLTIALTDVSNLHDTIRHFNPNLIVIDIRLKDADGRNVCRYLKQDLLVKCPVLLFSVFEYDERTISNSLADGFFKKTSDHLSMIKHIMQYLQ